MLEVRGKEKEMLICLQQEDRRVQRKDGGGENLPIGFEVLKVSSPGTETSSCTIFIFLKVQRSLSVSSTGGGEPLQPGAARSGAGSQLHVHGLPECYTEKNSGPRSLCHTAHYLHARSHRTLFATNLLPFSCPAQVCDSDA